MQVDFDAIKARATEVYNDFTSGQKAVLGVAAVGMIVGAFVFMQWAGTETYRPLFSGLEAEDAAEVSAELDSMGVPFKLQDGGRTISVPQSAVHSTRIELSAQGLPSVGSPGYDLLDDQSITTSEFRQRIDLQRAMEGELARTVASIKSVDRATVHLVMPEDDLFSGDDVHASASVLVEPVGGQALSATKVQAIVHLVASSVEGLNPAAVTVADDEGRILSAAGENGVDIAGVEARLGQKLAFENALARSIRADLLEPITGVGKARVVVSVDLDNDDRQTFSESFAEPDTSPVISQETSSEVYEGGGGPIVGGVLGPEIDPTVGEGEGDGTSYTNENSSVLFGVDKVTEQVTAAPGGVNRLSIAVVVDDSVGVDTAALSELVAAAAGVQAARGDTLQVTSMAFGEIEVSDVEGTSSSGASSDIVPTAIRSVAVVLLVIVVLLLAYRSAKKSSLAKYPLAIPLPSEAEDLLALEFDTRDDDDLEERGAVGAVGPAPGAVDAMGDPITIGGGDASPQLVLQNQIGALIDRQPEDVATVLRTWLADRRG